MQIIYPYNEILPKKKAHDIFIVHECASFGDLGWETTLVVGRGSDKEKIFSHYGIQPSNHLSIETKFMIRKNNFLGLSWNLPFFLSCQREIRKKRPDLVFLSVRKQAAFHLMNKIPRVRYVYEVHELCYYPGEKIEDTYPLRLEKMVLSNVDLVTVTTSALKEILLAPPYSLKVPVEVIPLAVKAKSLPPPPPAEPLTIMYVGQVYAGQGLPNLLSAMTELHNIRLKIIGGASQEISHLAKLAKELAIKDRVEFLGFVPPSQLPSIVKEAHAFIAPFENKGRMPYVAHTKLFEYAEWGRPIIAPDLPIVREHFADRKGVLLFEPGNITSIAGCMAALQEETLREKLQREIEAFTGKFSWETRAKTYQKVLYSRLNLK